MPAENDRRPTSEAGGGGACNTPSAGTARAGGAGADGIVIVDVFL